MKLLLVTGMHRSGTSFLAELLHAVGVGIGATSDLLPPATDNPHGFFERKDVKDINDRVLAGLGGAWDAPAPRVARDWATSAGLDRLRREAEEVVLGLAEDVPDAPAIAIKDPRLSLTGPFWTSVSDPTASFVLLRDPDLVAESLRHRNGMSRRRGLDLWTRYTIDAVLDLPNPCVVPLASLTSDPEATLARVFAHAGLDADLGPAMDLARERSRGWQPPDLVASTEAADSVAGAVHAVLSTADPVTVRPVLARVARAWRGPGDDVALERIRHVHGDEAVGEVVAASRQRSAELEERVSDQRLVAEDLRRQWDEERRIRRGLERRVSNLEGVTDRAKNDRREMEGHRDDAQARAGELRDAAARSDTALREVRRELARAERQLDEARGQVARLEDERATTEDEDHAARDELQRLKGRRSVRAALGAAQAARPLYRTLRRVRRSTSASGGPDDGP